MTKDLLEQRLEEWARYVVNGMVSAGLGYKSVSPGFSEFHKSDRAPVVCDDREMEIERAVSALAQIDRTAAEVIRAEYHAHQKYGHSHYQEVGNDCKRTHKQIGISERTYRSKLEKAKAVIWTVIYVSCPIKPDALTIKAISGKVL